MRCLCSGDVPGLSALWLSQGRLWLHPYTSRRATGHAKASSLSPSVEGGRAAQSLTSH